MTPSSTFAETPVVYKEPNLKISTEPFPSPPTFADKYEEREYQKNRLALSFRIFHKFNLDEGVAGHITLRDPVEPTSFWVNPFGVPWAAMRAEDLIRVNAEGEVVDGGNVRRLNNAAYAIHHAIHTARPEVNCVAHSHSLYGRAFSCLGRTLDLISQDCLAFHEDHVFFDVYNGSVLATSEGEKIAKALGSKKAAILRNHGLLTCGETVESATWWFISLEHCCQAQLMVDAAAFSRGIETLKIDPAEVARTAKRARAEKAGYFSALPTFQVMEVTEAPKLKSIV